MTVVALAACTAGMPGASPLVFGIAVSDTAGGWCAEFKTGSGSLSPGAEMVIVFSSDSGMTSVRARLDSLRRGQCGTAFPQPRWDSYSAVSISVLSSRLASSSVGIAVIGDFLRMRGLQFRRCAADEGEHFTVWSGDPPVRQWHEYFDWGAIVDRTCKAGEDGRDDAK